MRWRGSHVILLLILSLCAVSIAQTPRTGPRTPSVDASAVQPDTTAVTDSPVAVPDSVAPIVSARMPALFDPRANMAWVEGRDITWTIPDASGRKRWKEGPRRTTTGFYMDRTEVTNEDFAQFLSASDSNAVFYDPRMDIVQTTKGQYRARAAREKFPVAWVDWTSAFAFAKWAKKSLPTEDEWIVAALDGKPLRSDTIQFLWTDSTQCAHLNLSGYPGRLAVGSYPHSATSGGITDLAGNVAEWTLSEETSNLPGGKSQSWAVIKGGSYLDSPESMTIFGRALRERSERLSSVGFRCILREQSSR
jgi:formylglycine-generating enzyme required for sulfatase activity